MLVQQRRETRPRPSPKPASVQEFVSFARAPLWRGCYPYSRIRPRLARASWLVNKGMSPAWNHRGEVTFPFGSAVKAGEPCRGLAWGGEPESLDVGNLRPRKERGNLCVPRGVRLRSPARRVGRRPPPPGRGGGGVRLLAPASKPKSERTSHNAAPDDPARVVQGDEGVGVRIHLRLSVVGRTVEHPSPPGGLDGGSDQCGEAGSLVIAERVAFDVPRVQSHRELARQPRLSAASAANHHDPLRDRPSEDRTRRHAHDGTSRGAGSQDRPATWHAAMKDEPAANRTAGQCASPLRSAYLPVDLGRAIFAGW